MAMNLELARHNMIESQVRTWEVLDSRVLGVLSHIQREDFVLPAYRNLAFADVSLPIAHGEIMMKPIIEGRMLQALAIQPEDQILEIGTGSGFITACLAHLGAAVTSIEQHADLASQAQARLTAHKIHNANIDVAEAVEAYNPRKTFDVLVVTGAVFSLPSRFRNWLNPNGRLFAIVGESPAMQAILYTRTEASGWKEESLFETDLPYLSHAEPPKRFTL